MNRLSIFIFAVLLTLGTALLPVPAFAQGIDPSQPDVSVNTSNTLYKISNLGLLIQRILQVGLSIVGLLILVYIVWGGIDWLLSGEDKGKVQAAQSKITQGIVGLALFASVFAIYFILQRFLGLGNRLNIFGGKGSTTGGGNGGGSQICTPGQTASDGGAGGYCTLNGQPAPASVNCMTTVNITYPHWEPCFCISGQKAWNWTACGQDGRG